MTAELVQVSHESLLAHRRTILEQVPDVADLRRRSHSGRVTPDERDLMLDLEEVDFLLGDDGWRLTGEWTVRTADPPIKHTYDAFRLVKTLRRSAQDPLEPVLSNTRQTPSPKSKATGRATRGP